MAQDIKTAEFSELVEHNSKVLSVFSPNGLVIASASQSQLHIWNVNLKTVSQKYECDNMIDFIKWSPDSELICCGTLKESVQVWKLDMPHWRCKISNNQLSFVNIHWAPQSQHLIVISEFYTKVTIFSLVSSDVTEIENTKAIENGIVFSPCERYMVVAQRVNFEDYLSIYSCDTWEVIKTFPVETKDLVSITFSPTDLVIAVLDSAVEYKVLFYSIIGRLIGKYTSEPNFGLISLSWNPKNLVAIGDCYSEVKILDCHLDFEVITSYEHPDTIESTDVTLYKVTEFASEMRNSMGDGFSSFLELDRVVKSRPISISPATRDGEKEKNKNPLKCGVQTLQFDCSGKYIASVDGNMPKTVFIYNVESFKLCDVITRGANIKSICWHPKKPYLIICSVSSMFDIWTPQRCIRHISPFTSFPISHAAWSPTGECILLNSQHHFSIVSFS